MTKFIWKEVLAACKGEIKNRQAVAPHMGAWIETIEGISTDTRTLKKGELFIALRGEHFDGHNFIADAVKKGACGVLVEKGCVDFKSAGVSVPVVTVEDTLRALGDLAAFHRRKFSIPIVGITGSNGKTTTKEMTAYILSARFNVLKNERTENNLVGLPLTLLALDAEDDVMVQELGTNHFGEIRRLAQILNPGIGVIINIGPSHLEYFGDLDGVLKEKSELLDGMESGSALILNGEDSKLAGLRSDRFKRVTFGFHTGCSFFAAGVKVDADFSEFMLNGKVPVKLNMPGMHNIENALASFAVGASLGLTTNEMAERISGFSGISQRLRKISPGGIDILDDTYNANPASVFAALKVFSAMSGYKRKILVLGDMLELGKVAEECHREIGRMAAETGADFIITTGALANLIRRGAIEAGFKEVNTCYCHTTKEAAQVLLDFAEPGDVILVKGSRRLKMEGVIECFTTSYTR